MANKHTRYSDNPVNVGDVHYVGVTGSSGKVAAHVVVKVLDREKVWDAEYKEWGYTYPYIVRLATTEEESAHLARTAR